MAGYKITVIKAPVGAIHTYCYLLETEHFLFLIDSAVASSAPLVDEALDQAGKKQLIVLNTHGHWDHTGLNGYLQKTRGALVGAHRFARKWMMDKDFHFTALYTSLLAQYPYDDAKKDLFYAECGEPSIQNLSLQGGEIFEDDGFALHVMHTPGHSNDCVCYFEEYSGALFCGDSLQGYGVLGNLPFYCDAALYLSSVEAMQKYVPRIVYGGHVILENKEAETFLTDCLDAFWKNDRVIRQAIAGKERRELTLQQIADIVAEDLKVINNIQVITSVRAQIKFIDDEY